MFKQEVVCLRGEFAEYEFEPPIMNSFISSQFVALYDYDPIKSSPNPNPALELMFREGDMMMVYDKSRSDGFYSAKVKDQLF